MQTYHSTFIRFLMLSALLFTACLPAVFANDGPVAVWQVADIVGDTLVDSSGNGHDLTISGAEAQQFMGRSFLRTGRDRYAIGPALGDGWSAFTLTAVVLQEREESAFTAIACRDFHGGPVGDVFGLLTDPHGNWVGRIMTAAGQTSLTAPIQTGWHHLALAYDGTAAQLYVDGNLVAQDALSGVLVSEPGTKFTIGCYSNLLGWYSGGVAEVRLYDQSLKAEAIAAAWTRWQEENPLATGFTFAQASDIHITDTKSIEILNDGVDMINEDPRIVFSLWLGDLTQDSTSDAMALARMGLDRLRRPYYAVRGNHDMQGGYYEREFGELNYTFEHAGWTFIMLDTNPGNEPLDEERLKWLREVLEATDTDRPLVLCGHHPLYPNTAMYLLPGVRRFLISFPATTSKRCWLDIIMPTRKRSLTVCCTPPRPAWPPRGATMTVLRRADTACFTAPKTPSPPSLSPCANGDPGWGRDGRKKARKERNSHCVWCESLLPAGIVPGYPLFYERS